MTTMLARPSLFGLATRSLSHFVAPSLSYVVALALITSLVACDAAYVDQRPAASDGPPIGAQDLARVDVQSRDGVLSEDGAQADHTGGAKVIARGTFAGRRNYQAAGTAELVRDGSTITLRFGDDFSVSVVPTPVVVLSKRDAIGKTIDPAQGDIELGGLKSALGAQSFAVPAGDGGQRYAWVYCKPFGVEVGRAKLEDQP